MDDYIFLIIAVVISIFAAINKNKKKTNEVNPDLEVETEENSRNFFMDQLLGDDFLNEPEEKIHSPAQAQTMLERITEIRASEVNPFIKDRQMKYKSTLPDLQKKNLQIKQKVQLAEDWEADSDAGNSPSYLEDFSLRKAFVYSEIMNRKYTMNPDY